MKSAKIFKSGNSQAVRLPREFRFDADEVYIKKVGRGVILIPKDDPWEMFEEGLGEFTEDFLRGERMQPSLENRGNW